jgi:hypothetical protein
MNEDDNSVAHQAGMARLLPKATFGLGAAVLAGVAVVTVPAPAAAGAAGTVTTTAALGAVINAVTGNGIFQTTWGGRDAISL